MKPRNGQEGVILLLLLFGVVVIAMFLPVIEMVASALSYR
jgi:hypothetical protein